MHSISACMYCTNQQECHEKRKRKPQLTVRELISFLVNIIRPPIKFSIYDSLLILTNLVMRVTVEIITGGCIDTEVSEDATVKNLKEKIAAEHGLPLNRLIFVIGDGGDEMRRRVVNDCEDESLLTDLGVRDGSHMYVFFKHLDLIANDEEEGGRGGGGHVVSTQDIVLEVERRWECGGEMEETEDREEMEVDRGEREENVDKNDDMGVDEKEEKEEKGEEEKKDRNEEEAKGGGEVKGKKEEEKEETKKAAKVGEEGKSGEAEENVERKEENDGGEEGRGGGGEENYGTGDKGEEEEEARERR